MPEEKICPPSRVSPSSSPPSSQGQARWQVTSWVTKMYLGGSTGFLMDASI